MHLPPFHTTLDDGTGIHVRALVPQDRALIRDGFARLSEGSRQSRFLGSHGPLSDDDLDRFSGPSTPDHYAIGAVAAGTPVATARFIRESATSAELAVTILDGWQNRGIGRLLLNTLMDGARLYGYASLTAVLRPDNHSMRRMLSRVGAVLIERDSSELTYRLPLTPPGRAG